MRNNQKMIWRKKCIGFGLCMALTIGMTAGCQKTPDVEYVTNKEGYNTLVQDNATMDNGVSVHQQVQAPEERIVETLEGTNEYTTIKIDASVTVPETTAIPVYQYGNLDVNSELAEQYVAALFDEGRVRSWNENCHIYTEEDYLAEIERLTKELEDGVTWDGYEITEDYAFIWESDIENYKLTMSSEELPESGYGTPVNYTFYSTKNELINGCSYEKEYLGFTGERNGIESNLYFAKDGVNEEIVFWRMPDIINPYKRNSYTETSESTAENSCRYTTEEAEEVCSEFLNELGFQDLVCGSIKNLEVLSPDDYAVPSEERRKGENGYCLHYYRSYDSNINFGAVKEQESHIFSNISVSCYDICSSYASALAYKDSESQNPGEDFELTCMEEVAMFLVTDDGIMSAAIINPMVTEECLAENVRLVSFDRVLEQAKAQLILQYGDTGMASSRDLYKIQAIELSYARMQSPNADREYILVPVWNFRTTDNGTTLVSINAIDGTVFDLESGY